MAFFLEQIRTMLPVLGFDFLRASTRPAADVAASSENTAETSPLFQLQIPRHGIVATGQEIDGEFYVLKGSMARGDWVGTERGYQSLYKQLVKDGVLVAGSDGNCRFEKDQSFSSPSAAAAVVSGRAANGRTSWKLENSGLSYGEWQDRQVSAAMDGDLESDLERLS